VLFLRPPPHAGLASWTFEAGSKARKAVWSFSDPPNRFRYLDVTESGIRLPLKTRIQRNPANAWFSPRAFLLCRLLCVL